MLQHTVKISLLLLHVSVQLDHPQGAPAEPAMCVPRAVLCATAQQSHTTRQAVHTSQPEIFATTTPHNI